MKNEIKLLKNNSQHKEEFTDLDWLREFNDFLKGESIPEGMSIGRGHAPKLSAKKPIQLFGIYRNIFLYFQILLKNAMFVITFLIQHPKGFIGKRKESTIVVGVTILCHKITTEVSVKTKKIHFLCNGNKIWKWVK